ncbi:MAG: ABC transporter substrate-binding protein, partial [Erysipelotrichaceae bacterium]|nr:ABC transporter substrate-binding protein [Erysipelotrichaceae bacterium]
SKKTLESKEYQDYLNNSGIDNNEHYYVKIEASKSLINNIDNTFVTEVFNGSASLRQAAGQLIEETVKAVNRNKTIDDEFFDNLYSNIKSLYKLDQTSSSALSRDLGPLPVGSKV